jgi:phosphoserine phosphatase
MADLPQQQNVLITVTGPDRAGITAALTAIIAEAGLAILDLEQVVVRGLLSLSLLLEYPPGEAAGQPVLKELLFAAKGLGLELDFRVVGAEAADGVPRRHKSVVTLIGHPQVPAEAIARIARLMADNRVNIETIQRLDQEGIRCLELVVSSASRKGARALKTALLPVGRECGVDIALQPDTIFRRVKRLVVFDLDSTLIEAEIIDELARAAGKAERVREITRRAMEGRLPFARALRQRVALLKGLDEGALEAVYRRVPFTPGAEQLIRVLQRMGYRTAIISGGFSYFTDRIQERLRLDYAYANCLEIARGRVTGRLQGEIIDGAAKARLLERIARSERIELDQVIAIGDGANDLPMLKKAGLGVAFNARPAVREAAEHSLTQRRLDTILFLLGVSQREVAGLMDP